MSYHSPLLTPHHKQMTFMQSCGSMSGITQSESLPVGYVLKKLSTIGLYTFGGTPANLALFYRLFVEDENWISADKFAEFLAFAQSIPGPTGLQVLALCTSYITGTKFAGFVVSLFFSMPAALFLAGTGLLFSDDADITAIQSTLKPIEIVVACGAVGVVLGGALKLAEKLVKTKTHKVLYTLSVLACLATTVFPAEGGALTIGVLLLAGSTTAAMAYYEQNVKEKEEDSAEQEQSTVPVDRQSFAISPSGIPGHVVQNLAQQAAAQDLAQEVLVTKTQGSILLGIIVMLLMLTSLVSKPDPNTGAPKSEMQNALELVPIFFKVGCLVFGGGPVVVPLLLIQLTSLKLITQTQFVTAFAIQQLMPGPMFNISAFFGALLGGIQGAVLGWIAMLMPGIIIMYGLLPFWNEAFKTDRSGGKSSSGTEMDNVEFNYQRYFREALPGLNAAAAGLMGGAVIVLWQKLITQNILRVGLAVALFSWQVTFGVKPMIVIIFSMALGMCILFTGETELLTMRLMK